MLARQSKLKKWLLILTGVSIVSVAIVAAAFPEMVKLLVQGDEQELVPDQEVAPPVDDEPTLLLIALDGVDRDLLYDMLNRGELPELASLLSGGDADWPHAYFAPNLLSTLPSSTLPAWATVFTGATPAEHGVSGNEYFVRESQTMQVPAPVSIDAPSAVVESYTESYANRLLMVPTIYERLRDQRPEVSIWVCLSHFFAGASRFLLADRTVITDAFQAVLSQGPSSDALLELYSELDEEVVEQLIEALESESAPHLITLYLVGTDHYAHTAEEGPDPARRTYLKRVVDPLLARLRAALDVQSALDRRYVIVTSDHGHTAVKHDARHALSTEGSDEPPAVLLGAGFRLRPFEREVDEDVVFDSVLAYGGAMAYLYLADRSSCEDDGGCDWQLPPRYEEDVLVAAEAYYAANQTGRYAPGMRGTLDLVLTRRPRPFAEDDLPFEVYVGDGQTQPIAAYLAEHPRPTYVAFESRLRDLAAGRYGERAGDVLLLARNGDVEEPEERYYFAGRYHSWHGSPSRRDSEVPLIVAHPQRSAERLANLTEEALGSEPRQQDLARLFMRILMPDEDDLR